MGETVILLLRALALLALLGGVAAAAFILAPRFLPAPPVRDRALPAAFIIMKGGEASDSA